MSVLDALEFHRRGRLPSVLQTEAAECGLACLVMIAVFYGQVWDLASLRRRFAISLKGATLQDIMRIAEQMSFATRPVRLELDELPLLRTPCILHWDLNHFVVLKSADESEIVIHDPIVGVRRLTFKEASRHFTGVALEMVPTGAFESSTPPPRVRLWSVMGRVVGLGRSLGQVFTMALAIEVLAVLSPLFLQWVIDDALVAGNADILLTLVLAFSLLLVIRTSISGMRAWLLIGLGASLKVQGRTNLFTHLVNLPAAYFESRHLGDVMSRFGSQDTIMQAITTDVVEAVLDGLLAVITLGIMFVLAPGLAALVLAGAVAYMVLRWTSYRPLRDLTAEGIIWSARRDSHFLETLRGMAAIKIFNAQEGRRTRWMNLLVQSTNRQISAQKLRLFYRVANSLLLGGLAILVVWLGALRVIEATMTVGMLIAFLAYKDQFLSRASALVDRAVDLQMLKLHAERLGDIALTKPEPREARSETLALRGPLSIEVVNLRYRYSENDPWVLDGVTFRVDAGESVAIAGPSGCGKTTLLKLMIGLLRPTEGEIFINGQPLSKIGIDQYRALIGVVMQDDQLFSGSIADNITFFSDRPDAVLMEDSASAAAVHDDIEKLPMGYHTLLGDMGTVLSGGQKQRVLIARALYRKPRILFLDEATSHLDVSRESQVNSAVQATKVTRIVVAHRPETIRSADRVIRLESDDVKTQPVLAA